MGFRIPIFIVETRGSSLQQEPVRLLFTGVTNLKKLKCKKMKMVAKGHIPHTTN